MSSSCSFEHLLTSFFWNLGLFIEPGNNYPLNEEGALHVSKAALYGRQANGKIRKMIELICCLTPSSIDDDVTLMVHHVGKDYVLSRLGRGVNSDQLDGWWAKQPSTSLGITLNWRVNTFLWLFVKSLNTCAASTTTGIIMMTTWAWKRWVDEFRTCCCRPIGHSMLHKQVYTKSSL